MCGICAAIRPYDPDCPYTGAAATAAQKMLAELERLGIEIADAAALFGDPIALQNTLPFDPWKDIGFPERDPTAITSFFDIPSGPSTSFYLSPGARLVAEISWLGDTDWFGMQLQQGQTYQISLTSLPFLGLGDPQLYLFDNNANLLLVDDNSGGGVNSLLTITATRTGVYFIGATGFGGGGSTTGGYMISLSQVNFAADTVGDTRATAARAEVGTPIDGSIDFIGDVDRYAIRLESGKSYYFVLDALNSRNNPLGDPKIELLDRNGNLIASNDDNGITRNSFLAFDATRTGDVYIRAMGAGNTTGDFRLSAVELPPQPAVDLLAALDWGVQLNKTNIRYYFASTGESVMQETTSANWSSYEIGQAEAALNEFAQISTLTFTRVNSRAQADFVLGKGFLDSGLSGKMAPPDPQFASIVGQGWFNIKSDFWSDRAGGLLEPGAYGYKNFVHEFGHGLGLSHPHDNGGGSSQIFPGVRTPGDLGTLNMNQEIWTAMSYINGWRAGPEGASGTLSYGIAMGPMALDIAVIQRKYGVNTSFATGDDNYTLVTVNQRGTGYKAIWDAGGRDSINHTGDADAFIDLRAATLKFEEVGGGGYVSWVKGIFGGFTIANGVVIENARGGGGADVITGNAAANMLRGNDGRDSLSGLGGNDRLFGGARFDTLSGGTGNDTLDGGTGNDVLTGGRGADSFVFSAGYGRDRVKDFNGADGDRLLLDTDLWAGQTLTRQQVVTQLASVVGSRMVFDFGDGDLLELQGITSKAGLADFLVFA